MSSTIKNVIIIGASGYIGQPILSTLISSGFSVSVLTRESSPSTFKFPDTVTVHITDYSIPSLLQAFKNQDAIVSAITTFSTAQQVAIIDAAITAGVKRFVPSEYGIDSSLPDVQDVVPAIKGKKETIAYLREKEFTGLSWTAICVGAFFDGTFRTLRSIGWDVPGRKAVIFDDGNNEYEATNLDQIARTVAAVLSGRNLEITKNEFVYVNSFTVTQNRVLAALEKVSGEEFKVERAGVAELSKRSLERLKSPDSSVVKAGDLYDRAFPIAHFGAIVAAIYGHGGFDNYSKTRGLWNEKLGLPKEDLDATLTKILEEFKVGEN
jgi:NAD(P)-dependent dehydrogenase (short-subunit alcohol dehydrogenase family)